MSHTLKVEVHTCICSIVSETEFFSWQVKPTQKQGSSSVSQTSMSCNTNGTFLIRSGNNFSFFNGLNVLPLSNLLLFHVLTLLRNRLEHHSPLSVQTKNLNPIYQNRMNTAFNFSTEILLLIKSKSFPYAELTVLALHPFSKQYTTLMDKLN